MQIRIVLMMQIRPDPDPPHCVHPYANDRHSVVILMPSLASTRQINAQSQTVVLLSRLPSQTETTPHIKGQFHEIFDPFFGGGLKTLLAKTICKLVRFHQDIRLQSSKFACPHSQRNALDKPQFSNVKRVSIWYVNTPKDFISFDFSCQFKPVSAPQNRCPRSHCRIRLFSFFSTFLLA